MSKEESKTKVGYLKYIGILLFLIGATLFIATFQPVISSYLDYFFSSKPNIENVTIQMVKEDEEITKDINKDTEIVFVDSKFGLYIPKIKANSTVVKNVNPYNRDEYSNALISGVAHAKGSNLPNESGNVFLFAHSAVNFYENRKYNVYFYLLGELKKDDEIYVSYNNDIYKYKVSEVKIVDRDDIQYLGKYLNEDTVTLMTCWPAGSDIKRMIVVGVRSTSK